YVINVDRNDDVGTPVTQLSATDDDDVTGNGYGRVSFVVTSGNDDLLFDVDANTGHVSVAKPLTGRGVGSIYEIQVTAVDGGGLSSDVDASVVISIVDGSGTGGAVFTQSRYLFRASEDADISDVLGRVSAAAEDGGSVTYFIRHDPPRSSWFAVRSNGDVIVTSQMDREVFSTVSFQVIASSGTPPIFGFAMVTVEISDVNDNAPHFLSSTEGALGSVTIPYTTLVGGKVHSVVAVDDDQGRNGQVNTFGILYMGGGCFCVVDENTGVITLSRELPQHTTDYSLNIEAYDEGEPPQVTQANLLIHTTAPDVNCPVFPAAFRFSVAESTPLSKSNIQATTINSTAKIAYFIQSSSSSFIFSIFSNGSLYLNKPLDHETQDFYTFKVKILKYSLHLYSCYVNADVTIDVTDVNDNSPIFTKQTYKFSIEENLAGGSEVGIVSATDVDANDDVFYTFAVDSNKFSINRATGVVTTLVPLDHDIIKEHSLLVQASDGKHLAESMLRITVNDINDNSPQFLMTSSEHLAVVSVDSEIDSGSWVASLKAADKDSNLNGQVSYTMTSQDNQMFRIDGNTGSIMVNTALLTVRQGLYTVHVNAQDQGSPSRHESAILQSTLPQIRVRTSSDNPAEFDQNKFVFCPIESSNPGSILGTVTFIHSFITTFPQYEIVSSNDGSVFHVNKTTGEVMLLQRLDFEARPQYLFQVEKKESNDVTKILSAQINLRDVNDHTPQFASGSMIFGVEENTRIGKEVYRFHATDHDSGINGQLTFTLVSQSPSSVFRMNRETGELIVDAGIDREDVDQYILVVNVTDGSLTSPLFSSASAHVIVRDVNDNAPRFIGRHVTFVAEDEPVGFPISQISAEDADAGTNGRVVYSIVSVTSDIGRSIEEMSYFHVDPNTGVLTVAKQLDYERSKTHFINVSASDLAPQPQTTYQMFTIHVTDVNDIAPHFERETYEAEVIEGQSIGTIVTRVTALDEDSGENGIVTYELQPSSETEAFLIDPTNGVITLTMELDRENKSSYRLTVFAQDNSFPVLYDWCTVVVTLIDINDNTPQFSPLDGTRQPPLLARLEIPEHMDGPQVVHTIAASDDDAGDNGRVTYSISGGNIGGDFSLNPSSGELSITRRLDRESTSSYQLQVVASDNGEPVRSASGLIDITVLDWNDNDPQFTETAYSGQVEEGLTKGQYVLTVRATDADIGLNGEVSYFISTTATESNVLSGQFSVDTMTGVLTTSTTLDREVKGSYNFFVTAVDAAPYGPRSSMVPVTITVTDVNDNPPVFDESLILVNISRSISPGMEVARVRATDADSGLYGEVTYRFGNSSANQTLFEIDRVHGNIRMRESIPSNFPAQSSLMVIASDGGVRPLQTSAVVQITIIGEPINFAFLEFDEMSYEVSMSETVQKGHRVTAVRAALRGATSGGHTIIYDLHSGNEDNAFVMSQDGEIRVNKPNLLDFETEPNIRLIVSASVAGGGLFSAIHGYATVYIQLQDENDNSPRFTQDIYSIRVWEDQQPGIFVMPVLATDADSENNGWVRYFISSGNLDNSFELEPVTGYLKTRLKLDREVHEHYILHVNAMDQGDTVRRTGSCTVSIQVVDINDHSPTLNVPSGPLLVSEDTAVGSHITTVTANDRDASPIISFSFPRGGNPGSHFSIDRNDGKIYLNKALDFEIIENFSITVQASDVGLNVTHNVSEELYVVVTDVNDNSPVFRQQSYHTLLPELSPPHSHVITVEATDLDSGENGRITYRLDNVLPNKPIFVIDPDTGEITTNKSEALNPQSSVFNLEIEAFDHGVPPRVQSVSVRVQITDVNNNPPTFSRSQYEASVSESASRDFSIINVTATDADYSRDNNVIMYRIISGNTGGAFKIRTLNGPGKQTLGELCVAGDLDRETTDRYFLIVAAIDQGTPSLSSNATVVINVRDVNDNRPRFNKTSYYGRVAENRIGEAPGPPKPVLQLYAEEDDLNSDFKFKIIAGNDDNAFELSDCDPPTGDCAMLVAKYVDYEIQSHYELTVQVWDDRNSLLAKSSIVGVTVDIDDVNEYAPKFTILFKQVKVEENTRANTTIFILVADDKDGGRFGHVIYNVTSGRARSSASSCVGNRDIFRVNPDTGEVYATQDLDFEVCSQYFFYVTATDEAGDSVMIPVSIEVEAVDEYAPVFNIDDVMGYRFQVPYGSPERYVVGQVNATDDDVGADGDVRYFLEDSSTGHGYVINATSGVIRLSEAVVNGNAKILRVSARSTHRKTITHVTVEITGTPIIPPEAQVLSIVFGVIAGIACVIVLILLGKHCYNKRAYRERNKADTATSKTPSRSPAESDAKSFYDVSSPHDTSPTSATQTRGKPMNGVHRNGLHEPTHTGNDGSAEDEEVLRINSTSPSSGQQSSSASLIHDRKDRVPDSGIQQDIDRSSTDTPTAPLSKEVNRPQSVESIHEFGEEGGGEDVLVTMPPIRGAEPPPPANFNLDDRHRRAVLHASLGVLKESPAQTSPPFPNPGDWRPDYQPLSSVFSEIARLREESNAIRHAAALQPPPLLTAVPHQGTEIAAPVPLSNANSFDMSPVSLPRSPISHESSFTSPAMSPSVSPSLTPITTHTPSPYTNVITPSFGVKVTRSKSDETNLSSERPERILHV
uniref:Cadherin domain-containing protein n=1 Tax=Ciona intestinalis TaxID=7719 RepID=F6YY38_CIOIN